MRRPGLFSAAAIALIGTMIGAGPSFAEFGAIAYDQNSGRYGFSWNKSTREQANDLAKKDCSSANCRLFPVPPGQCGALATADNPKESSAWGVSVHTDKAEAEARAVMDCKKHTEGQCRMRGSECNR
jgi:Domain of unknown function (DUF4189)